MSGYLVYIHLVEHLEWFGMFMLVHSPRRFRKTPELVVAAPAIRFPPKMKAVNGRVSKGGDSTDLGVSNSSDDDVFSSGENLLGHSIVELGTVPTGD